MHNRILIEPYGKELKRGSLVIPEEVVKSRARVCAVGPGKYLPTGHFIEMRVKPGDIVVLDGTREKETSLLYWGGEEFLVATDDMVICRIDPTIEPEPRKIVVADMQHPDLQ